MLVVGKGAMLEANSKVILNANNNTMLIISEGAISDASGKVALVVGGRAVLVASGGVVLIKDELLATGNKAGPKPGEDRGPVALKGPATAVRAAMPVS